MTEAVTFEQFLLLAGEAVRYSVEERLTVLAKSSGTCSQAVRNLLDEHRFETAICTEFLTTLASCACSALEVQTALVTLARRFTMTGPSAEFRADTVLGRAVTTDEFARVLKEVGYYPTIDSARVALRELLDRPVSLIRSTWNGWLLGRHTTWSTFSADSPADPFAGFPQFADEIRAILGLRALDRGKPLLLMAYRLASGKIARVPTFADAYAGTPWQVNFRPSLRGATCGWTQPWEQVSDTRPGVPEVVHDPVAAQDVCLPLRQLT